MKRRQHNFITRTDSYKFSHYVQYPPGTTEVYSYAESRGGKWQEVVFFGLQYYIKEYLTGRVVRQWMIDEAEPKIIAHMGGDSKLFNRAGWQHIVDDHDGRLPLEIKAVPEGTVVPNSNILMSIRNTCPECFWLTNYVETLLSKVWYPSTIATQSREFAKMIRYYCVATGASEDVSFKLHDFGYRGSTSEESAGIGGAAHLISFMGTDTFRAIEFLEDYYECTEMPGFSIPAAEHSTITSWGRENEYTGAFANMLDQYPEGLVAVVSDSYDIFKAIREGWGEELKERVMSRNGRLVIRPDSGPLPETPIQCIDAAEEAFGYTLNAKGFRALDAHVGLIQGDGINFKSVGDIGESMISTGKSMDDLGFGSGGGLLQNVDRDTLEWAIKCSEITINGKSVGVFKDPITSKAKKSKKGKLGLYDLGGKLYTLSSDLAEGVTAPDLLQTVFLNGKAKNSTTFAQVRERAAI